MPEVISLKCVNSCYHRTFITCSGHSLNATLTRGSQSDFYATVDVKSDEKLLSNLFNTRSNELHAMALKPIKKYYIMSSVLKHELLLDEIIETFVQKLGRDFAKTEKCVTWTGDCFCVR